MLHFNLKGALSDFCQTVLIFESTKTNTQIPQLDLALILKSLPHTYVHNHGSDDHGHKWRWHASIFKQKPTQISCLKRSKINVNLEETMQPQRPVPGPAPWVLFTAGKLLRYLHKSYLLPDHNPFNVFFLWYLPLFYLQSLSIYSRSSNILCSQIECSLPSLITRPPPPPHTQSDPVVKIVFFFQK